MHKKHSKSGHQDRSSTSKRGHAKSRKDTDDSALEIMKVPQNSRNELSKRFGNGEVKEKSQLNREKHKHKRDEVKSSDRHDKSRHEKKLFRKVSDVQSPVPEKESVKRKEKKDKRDKERLNKIEKYLEGLNKDTKLIRNRSLSLGTSESLLKHIEKHIRREKTFHVRTNRDVSTDEKDQRLTTTKEKKLDKKHKLKESRKNDSSKEKDSKDNQKSVMYCEVEMQSPFLQQKKKFDVERLYPKTPSKERKPSSSKEGSILLRLQTSSTTHKDKMVRQKEKKTAPAKPSSRKSKMDSDTKGHKYQKSDASLGPYSKYFMFDKRSQKESETTHQKKKKRRKIDSATKISHDQKRKRSKEDDIKPKKTKENQQKGTSSSDQYKMKIEDDIKSYFSKIQSLIDKKLDFILGSNDTKGSRSGPVENEDETDRTKNKKEKKAELKEQEARDRNHAKRRKRSETHKSMDDEKHREENTRERHREEEKKDIRKSRRGKDTRVCNISLKRERYPSEDSKTYRRCRSPQQQRKYQDNLVIPPSLDKRESNKEIRHHRCHRSPYGDSGTSKMSPDRLIKMLEHPSTFSVQSKASIIKEKLVDEVKHKPNDTQPGPTENEYYQKKIDIVPVEEQTLPYRGYTKKSKNQMAKPSVTYLSQSKTSFVQEKIINGSKCKLDEDHSRCNENVHRQKRDKSLSKRNVLPGEDDFKVENADPTNLQGALNKKLKKRIKQLMNLECKTVSIVGIPSQIRESAIFNETQTTTSLNVINPIEDAVEQKKKSKRFKLYYKYSVADNKCANESDKSSEEKKSIVSDSYRVVSDPSDHNIDVWEEKGEDSKNVSKGSDDDLSKIIFIMKKEKVQKNCGDINCRHAVMESKKHRKRSHSPKAITLNNILEEPSNVSVTMHHNETPSSKKDINCTFFNTLKSSNSDCNLDMIKKSIHKHKNRHPDKFLKEDAGRPKSYSKKSPEEDHQRVKLDKKIRNEEKRGHNKKLKKIESLQKIKKKNTRNMYKYTSKSDINISYDSLRKYKFNKEKHKSDSPSHFREQLRQLLPDIFIRKPSPERKNIDTIIKEELRGIIKEIPRDMVSKMLSIDDLKQMVASKCINMSVEEKVKESQETHQKEPDDNPKTKDLEEKKFCSKKIGTHQPMTRIPSLIKGYTGIVTSQITKEEPSETCNTTNQVDKDEISETIVEELNENNLVDAATEVSAEMSDKAVIILENKKSQTPNYLHTPIGVLVCDPTKQSIHSTKVTANNMKRCQLIDPFTNVKVACLSKSTRPIINLENKQFPNRKLLETDIYSRPVSAQYKRQKSSVSEGKCVKFNNKERSQSDAISRKPLGKRPATTEGNRKDETKIPLDKFRKRPSLTVSTNIVTINTPICAETYEAQTKASKRNIKNTTCLEKNKTHGNLSSKSASSLNDVDMDSRIGSLVCIDRYNNFQKINLSSNTNSRSLDRYTTKSIIGDNPHSSRLFFTKSFNVEMNTYQRRKMYDENIRKNMKKRSGTPNKMGPQVFEVRYLTLENGNLDQNSNGINSLTPAVNQKCISKLPTFNAKINKVRQRAKTSKPFTRKSRRNFPKNKEDACKFSGRDIFAPIISDVDQLNKFRRKTFPEKKIEEIFVKDEVSNKDPISDSIKSSSLMLKDKDINAEQTFKTDKIASECPDQNFKDLIDCLYNSIISYCDTKFKCPQEEMKSSGKSDATLSQKTTPPVNEKSYVVLPKASNENDALKKNSSSDGNLSGAEKQSKHPVSLLSSHLSCPVLAGSTSSFDYLYEDGPIELNKEAILLHFKKPLKTILGYALNRTNPIRNETFRSFPRKDYQISNSATQSEESGYSSDNSKKCISVCSFFKKPSIVNLFKPVKKLEPSLKSTSSLNDSTSGPNFQEYNVMNQKCIEYAEKVRNQTQNKDEPEKTFQEIPLDILLFYRKSSTLLSDFNSNCSLCKKHSNSDLPYITEGVELNNNARSMDQSLEVKYSFKDCTVVQENIGNKDDIQAEAMIFYEDCNRRPSLEIISLKKSETNFPIDHVSLKEVAQCPVVLSITNLNSYSLTLVEKTGTNNTDPFFGDKQYQNSEQFESDVVDSYHSINQKENCNFMNTDLKSLTHTDFDCKSDVSSVSGFRCASSPAATSKAMAKKFFENLLKVYEKEIYVTNKLFRDDHFFVDVLLESVKTSEVSKTKSMKLKKFIKGTIKNYIGNLFLPKSHVDKLTDTQANCSTDGNHQRKLRMLAGDARKYFSMFVQAVKTNKDINDEIKICGLLKLIERIEDGDFAILRVIQFSFSHKYFRKNKKGDDGLSKTIKFHIMF